MRFAVLDVCLQTKRTRTLYDRSRGYTYSMPNTANTSFNSAAYKIQSEDLSWPILLGLGAIVPALLLVPALSSGAGPILLSAWVLLNALVLSTTRQRRLPWCARFRALFLANAAVLGAAAALVASAALLNALASAS